MKFENDYSDFGIENVEPIKKNSSGEVYVLCPSCEPFRRKKGEKKLAVNVEKGTWYCQHCGWTGGLTPYGWKRSNKSIDVVKSWQEPSEKMYHYWKSRKISRETVNAREIKMSREQIRQKDGSFLTTNCMVFIFRQDGATRMVKYRDKRKNFKIEKNSTMILWGLQFIKSSDEMIITEGEPDAMSWHEAGYMAAVSVPSGTQITQSEREEYLKTGKLTVQNHLSLSYFDNCIEFVEKKKMIYIGTDNDAAGHKLRLEIGRRFGYERCKILDYGLFDSPDGNGGKRPCKDANEVLLHNGSEALKYVFEQAKDFPIDDIVTSEEVLPEIYSQYDFGYRTGKSTGIERLDPHFTLRIGHLIAINGYGGMGKSTLALNIALLTSVMYGWKWGVYLPENYPVPDAYMLMMEMYIGNTLNYFDKSRAAKSEIDRANEFIKDRIFCVNNKNGYSPEELRNIKQSLIMRHGIVGFITDPWNALNHPTVNNLDSYLERELSAEQRLATNNKIINIICVHPPTPDKAYRKNPPAPSIYEITGGGVWSKKVYDVICVHQEDRDLRDNISDTSTHVHVQKTKHHKLVGMPTKGEPVLLELDRKSQRFIQPPINVKVNDDEEFANEKVLDRTDPFVQALKAREEKDKKDEEENLLVF